jgi:alkylation response protein AidB-like acyl-CoA dehydrogenase
MRLDLADHTILYETFVAALRRGEPLGADVSMLKVHQSELCQRTTDLMLEIAGENAGLLRPMEGNRQTHPAGQFIEARPYTIYGGSSEIQRNILAKNVLGLPD